ncbi:MAG: radical SAM protein [Pseudomonadota bacterium]
MSEPETTYKSCRFLETGLSFSALEVRACAVVHHGRGRPILWDVRTSPTLDVQHLMDKKAEIRAANQGEGYAECVGCPHLETKDWGRDTGKVSWLGITNYLICNVLCTYCWLNYADYSPLKKPGKPVGQFYAVGPLIDQLFDQDLFGDDLIVDWGGGGEPTLSPDFDRLFTRFAEFGALQWLHTNAVRFPKLFKSALQMPKVRVLCSLDAASRATYERVKQRDKFDIVVQNLRRYAELGGTVVPKYIVIEDNADPGEGGAFVDLVASMGVRTIVTDVDYRNPEPSPRVIATLRAIKARATEAKIQCRFDAVGSNSVRKDLLAEINA